MSITYFLNGHCLLFINSYFLPNTTICIRKKYVLTSFDLSGIPVLTMFRWSSSGHLLCSWTILSVQISTDTTEPRRAYQQKVKKYEETESLVVFVIRWQDNGSAGVTWRSMTCYGNSNTTWVSIYYREPWTSGIKHVLN